MRPGKAKWFTQVHCKFGKTKAVEWYPIQVSVLWSECIMISKKLSLKPVSDTSVILRKAEPTLIQLYCILSESAHAELPLAYLFWCFMLLKVSYIGSCICKITSTKLHHSNFVDSSFKKYCVIWRWSLKCKDQALFQFSSSMKYKNNTQMRGMKCREELYFHFCQLSPQNLRFLPS